MPNNDRTRIAAGHYDLKTLELTNFEGERVDISSLVSEMTIVENMYYTFMEYEFIIIDAVNLLEKYVITGNEKIRMVMTKRDRPNLDEELIEKYLVVSKIGDFTRPNNEGQAYRLKAISETAFAASIHRVSRSISGSLAETLSTLYADVNHKTPLNTLDSSTEGNYSLVIPNWTYNDTFRMLLGRAQRADGTIFLMYETLWHDHILTSYSEVVKRSPYDKYKQLSHDPHISYSEKSFDSNRTRIRKIQSIIGSSQYESMQTGGINSRVHTIDIATKKYTIADFSVLDENTPRIDKDVLVDRNLSIAGKNISEYKEPRSYTVNVNTMAYEGSDNLHNKLDIGAPRRTAVYENQFAISHMITVEADTNLRAGEMIEIELPPAIDPDALEGEWRDDLLSGRYMIESVRHKFKEEGSTYSMELNIRRDSINRNMITGKYKYLDR